MTFNNLPISKSPFYLRVIEKEMDRLNPKELDEDLSITPEQSDFGAEDAESWDDENDENLNEDFEGEEKEFDGSQEMDEGDEDFGEDEFDEMEDEGE